MQQTFYDAQSRPVRIGAQIGEGGEGIVYHVQGQPENVAKIYFAHKKPPVDKIRQLVAGKTERLAQIASWPLTTLHTRKGGSLAGVLMPRIADAKESHDLYLPEYRAQHFPRADWRFLVQVAINCAEIFEEVHRAGFCVADINQRNVLVRADASVTLVDCDSFQVRISEKKIYRCEVATSDFTSFELQDADLRETDRTENHDCFGLAVMIFRLLMDGKHPFSGVRTAAADTKVETAIRLRQFAYTRSPGRNWPKVPPGAQTLDILSFPVAALFELAFAPNSDTAGRPTAAAWRAALVEFRDQLQQCPKKHYYHPVSPRCPWCKHPIKPPPPPVVAPKPKSKKQKGTAPTWAVPKFIGAFAFIFLMYFLVFGLMFRAKYSQFFPEPDLSSSAPAVVLPHVPQPTVKQTLPKLSLVELEQLLLRNHYRQFGDTSYDQTQALAVDAIRELDPNWFDGPRHERVVQELFAQLQMATYWTPVPTETTVSFERVIRALKLLKVKRRYSLPAQIAAAFDRHDKVRAEVRRQIRELDPDWRWNPSEAWHRDHVWRGNDNQ